MPNTKDDGIHENETAGHDVRQLASDGSLSVLIDNLHGSNGVITSASDKVHLNVHTNQHEVDQVRSGGNHVTVATNANGSNLVVHSDDGSVVHINTMHDGWVA